MRYQAEVTRESRKAICCHLDGDTVDHWIPRGEIQPGSSVEHASDRGLLVLSDWFVRTARLPVRGEDHGSRRDHGIDY